MKYIYVLKNFISPIDLGKFMTIVHRAMQPIETSVEGRGLICFKPSQVVRKRGAMAMRLCILECAAPMQLLIWCTLDEKCINLLTNILLQVHWFGFAKNFQ